MAESASTATERPVEGEFGTPWEMWRAVGERLAGEDVRTSYADALDVVRAVGGENPPKAGAPWRSWDGHRLKALYLVVVSVTGGAGGTEPVPAGLSQPRLLELRRTISQRLNEVTAPDDTLSADDVAAVQALAVLDGDCDEAARLVVAGQAGDEVLARLHAAADGYRTALDDHLLSLAGRRLVAWKGANALEWLARAHTMRGEHADAWTCFSEACAAYEEAADPVDAQRCRDKMMESGQRRAPDADVLLKSLITQLDAATPATLAHAGLLVGLAELCIGQNDVYGAKQWTKLAVADLADQHYPVAAGDRVEPTVTEWCHAIPVGEPGQNRFFATLGALIQMHATLAMVLQVTEAEAASRHEAVIEGLADVVTGLPAQMEAVGVALDARLEGYVVPGWTRDSAESMRANAQAAADQATYSAVMRGVNRLLDSLGAVMSGAAEPGPAADMAESVVSRARAACQPGGDRPSPVLPGAGAAGGRQTRRCRHSAARGLQPGLSHRRRRRAERGHHGAVDPDIGLCWAERLGERLERRR